MSKMMGRIRLKNLSELQSQKNDIVDNAKDVTCIEDIKTTPAKLKERKVRAATTTKKRSNDETKAAHVIITSTAIKRTGKKEPLPGQLRIDKFFKSSTKCYKVEEFRKISPEERKPGRQPRKGCKRLFPEEPDTAKNTTKKSAGSPDIELDWKPTRKRAHPLRKAKTKCPSSPSDIIDLCSDGESEAENNTSVNQNKPKCNVKCVLEKTSPMVIIPRLNIQNAKKTDTHSKENIPRERKRKPCPSYKVVEDTTFVVDGFQFGDIPNATHYFLSHYHADHYIGLTRKFAHPLYMSPITASLVRVFIPIDSQYLHEIDVDKSITINDIEITAIDANHCPGAIMLLFKFSTGKCILHTGDFRASFEMESLPIFWNQPNIDILYLDTTYLSKNYDFCHQSDSIDSVCSSVRQFHEKNANKRILHVCGAYLIGKEKVWLALVEEFSLRVWTEPNRRKAINCLNQPELQGSLCDDPFKANLHVLTLGKISYPHLDQYFKQFEGEFDILLGIRPSGWEKNSKPSFGKRISVIGVEYSEHSSYKELERFVRFLKPKKVISTVPVGKDLCVTPSVPTNWYKYKGCAGMISNSFQPSISTFLETPKRKLPTLTSTNTNMILSPLKKTDAINADDVESCVSVIDDPHIVNEKFKLESVQDRSNHTLTQHVSRFTSDASDDLLSLI